MNSNENNARIVGPLMGEQHKDKINKNSQNISYKI